MKGLTTLFADTKANGKYITSGENGSFSDGVATGTALKYVAEKNGKLSVSFTGLGAKKVIYVVEENSKQTNAVASTENSSETEKMDGKVEADVVAGTTYYIYGAGTKACFSGAEFTPAD